MSDAETKPAAGKPKVREVLFFELEYIATTGRQAAYEAVKTALKAKDIEVTPISFGKHGIVSRPSHAVKALIDASGKNLTTGDQLAAQVEAAMLKFFEEKAEINKDLPPLIKAAQERDIQAVALSPWPEKVASALLKKLGLEELGVDLEASDCREPAFPRADHWLRMLKDREQDTLPIISIASSRIASKGALTAGATCIAVPDELTSFEDFAGSKIVLESLGEMKLAELLDLVCRR